MSGELPAEKYGSDRAIIRVEDFSAEYNGTTILQNINFEVYRCEVLVIAGESGCGKSTLLRHLVGLEAPAHGRILFEGNDLALASRHDRQRILRNIGVAFQSGALFHSMTVLENVALPLQMFTPLTPAMIEMVALTKLQLVGMAAEAQKSPSELSGGMQKRAAIARALALDPAILILDEPTADLDPLTAAELDQLVLNLKRMLDRTFIIVSHSLPSIMTVADRVLLLNREKKTIVAQGNPRELESSNPDPWVRAFLRGRMPDDNGQPAQRRDTHAPDKPAPAAGPAPLRRTIGDEI